METSCKMIRLKKLKQLAKLANENDDNNAQHELIKYLINCNLNHHTGKFIDPFTWKNIIEKANNDQYYVIILLSYHQSFAKKSNLHVLKEISENVKQQAKLGNAIAENNLAFMYKHGIIYEKNHDKYLKYINKAINQGLELAKHNLAINYYQLRDYTKSLELLKDIALLGNHKAQFNLAKLNFENPSKHNSDYDFFWMTKAAENGNLNAQYELGLYFYKLGEITTSIMWHKLSAKQGNIDSIEKLLIIYQLPDYYNINEIIHLSIKLQNRIHIHKYFEIINAQIIPSNLINSINSTTLNDLVPILLSKNINNQSTNNLNLSIDLKKLFSVKNISSILLGECQKLLIKIKYNPKFQQRNIDVNLYEILEQQIYSYIKTYNEVKSNVKPGFMITCFIPKNPEDINKLNTYQKIHEIDTIFYTTFGKKNVMLADNITNISYDNITITIDQIINYNNIHNLKLRAINKIFSLLFVYKTIIFMKIYENRHERDKIFKENHGFIFPKIY
ncbi:putative Sel1-like repeat-containing protein [Cotonvirus japonicus]|uniref:Sel1-like repeat-containing protein n=1 Tax=Cotonvirus japonicus TaxID=2811091 RepID=A0ABM7NTZ5_9VIRU|nr:putative Sel1-like repeat-containing protein [Cotonvirus japonicus]BCS83547.1 putative Sel1-like repeat-containing protein [Cotonvirus japonicus]